MMRRFTYLFTACLLSIGMYGQQFQSFTQYQWAGIIYNPAFAGADSSFRALAIQRSQWSGINDAPRSFQLALDAPNRNRKMGFGGSVFTDVTGPTKRFGFFGTYAYNLKISAKSNLRFGISFGLTQFTIDGSQITLREAGDQSLNGGIQQEMKPDAAAGVLWKGEKFYLGLSATQIFNNQLELYGNNDGSVMAVHGFATGGYRFDLGEIFAIEPSFLMKAVKPVPIQFDLSARMIYNKNLWLGATYRLDDAMAIFAGYQILDYLTIGYSYDITTSDIRNYSNGTHEIFIQIRFNRKQLLEELN